MVDSAGICREVCLLYGEGCWVAVLVDDWRRLDEDWGVVQHLMSVFFMSNDQEEFNDRYRDRYPTTR